MEPGIKSAKRAVRIAAFTFDLQAVADACMEARRREVEVKLMYSHSDRNTTKNQQSRLQALRSVGCQVRGWRGSRLHAKWLIADAVLVVGSCNFSEASAANVERGVRLFLSPQDQKEEEEVFDQYFAMGLPFNEGIGEPCPKTPERELG